MSVWIETELTQCSDMYINTTLQYTMEYLKESCKPLKNLKHVDSVLKLKDQQVLVKGINKIGYWYLKKILSTSDGTFPNNTEEGMNILEASFKILSIKLQQNSIFEAIRTGNLIMLMLLLPQGSDVNIDLGPYGSSPLHAAVDINNHQIAQFLIERGAELHSKNNNGRTLLHIAAWRSNFDMVKLLIDYKMNVNAYELSMGTPLMAATAKDNILVMKLLLLCGADINSTIKEGVDEGMTSLHIASQLKNCQAFLYLLNYKGININAVTKNNETALHTAVKSYFRNPTIIISLLNAGVDINVLNRDGKLAINCDNRVSSYKTIRLIKRHIVKLVEAGCFYICEKNIQATLDREFDNVRVKCRQELEFMKVLKLGSTNITFYMLLYQDIDQLTIDLRFCNEIKNLLYSRFLWHSFPMYQGILEIRLWKIHMTNESLKFNEIMSRNYSVI